MKRYLHAAVAYLALAVVFVLVFAANAYAAGVVVPDDNTAVNDMLRAVYDAFAGGHRVAAGALALATAVALLRRYAAQLPRVGPQLSTFLHTDFGGAVSAVAMSFFGAVGVATYESSLSWAVISTSFGVAAAAIGGYTILRRLVVDRLLASSWAPSWLKAVLSLAAYKPDPVADAVKAGDVAVKSHPSSGIDGVAPPPTKF